MPELPEVELVVRGLRHHLTGRTFTRIRVNAPAKTTVVSPSFNGKSFARLLTGRTVEGVDRRGKNILIRLSGEVTLWAHLKMTGKFRYLPKSIPTNRHDLVQFDLDTTPRTGAHLRFNDYRRFGRLRLFRDDELWHEPGLAKLGPEPLAVSAEDFVALCRRRPRMFKPALLDQSFLAGLGNIYADEALFAARLHPRRLTTSPTRPKLIELHGHIQRLLRKSLRLMGTTVDSYSGVNGTTGRFQSYLLVYGREGEPCPRCGRAIVREKIGSRSAHYCPRCQRHPDRS